MSPAQACLPETETKDEEEADNGAAFRSQAAQLFSALDAASPDRTAHWNLAFIGSTAGGGRGSALIMHRLSCLPPDTPVSLFTGTEKNLGFYQRFGFVLRSRHDVGDASAWWLVRP